MINKLPVAAADHKSSWSVPVHRRFHKLLIGRRSIGSLCGLREIR